MENSKKVKSPKNDNIKKSPSNSQPPKNAKSKNKSNIKQVKKPNNQEEIAKLKLKISELEKNIINLESQNMALKIENQKNIHDFQLKAKDFQTKATAQVNQIKSELNEKFIQDEAYIKKYSLQKFFESIIKPFTNLTQAIAYGANSHDPNVKAYVVGFEMYLNQLLTEFNDFGIVEIKPNVGDEFNSEIHQVISLVEGHKKNLIVEVKQNGFKFHDRVIQPASVIVGK